MPTYYDEKTKSWFCKFYYVDFTGTKKQKKKRGFKFQREAINNQISAIMNYAVRYYGLRENPCRKAGSIGKGRADEMQFWTTEEFTAPKTPKNIREISLPDFLLEELKAYTEKLYGLRKHDRIFSYTKHFFEHEMKRGTKDGEVKKIRLHDLRHPYVKHTTKI